MVKASELMRNRALWDSVQETNPKHTKEVKLGRSFTAIDPYRQIERATEVFGPAGMGWGWRIVNSFVTSATNQYVVELELWHTDPSQTIMQCGQAGLFIDRAMTKPDPDFAKKAVTDALTKSLSCLGFNADIFLGKFEDNKYVQEMAQKFDGVAQTDKKAANALAFAHKFHDALANEGDWANKEEIVKEKSKLLVSLGNYPEASDLAQEAIQKFVLPQYKIVLISAADRSAFLDLTATHNELRLIIQGFSSTLNDELVALEDEVASQFPNKEAS